MESYRVVGQNIPRIDAAAKVSGAARYIADMRREGMLYAKLLHSPWAHADIKTIDDSRARALPGVAAVITYRDVPAIPFTSCGHPYPPDTPEDTLILSRRLRYAGEPAAAVAAVTPEIAEEALGLIEVEYEELPAYFTPEDALAEGAVELHGGSKNICGESSYEIGDVDRVMAGADIIAEDEYLTPIIAHTPIEPHVSLCETDDRGRLVIHVSNQVPNIMRQRISYALGMKVGQVRIIQACVGGGFGGKQEPVFEPINAVLALATRRPVLLELSREECISCTRTRHASRIRMKTGITKDGRILAREMRVVNNTGAYASHGHNVVYNMASQFALLYPTPNLRFAGKTVYTNIPIAGAMRGYGIPQLNFAMESHIDHLARLLRRDPLEYRKQICYKLGDPINIEHFTVNTCGLPDIIRKCEEAVDYAGFRGQPKSGGVFKRGIGVSICSYGQSCYPHSVELSGARVTMHEDGSVTLFVNSAEIGQGADTVMLQIAAETLGIPHDWITVVSGDTDICPFDVGAFASRQTYVTGQAVKKAAMAVKKQILDWVTENRSVEQTRLDIVEGIILDRERGRVIAPLESVTMDMIYSIRNAATISHEAFYSPTDNMLTFGCTMAIVEVDTKTGKVAVEKLVSAFDSGRLINPLAALGQLNGGNIMCTGFGLSEQILIDPKTGRVYNDNLLDYKIPTFADVPEIEGYFVETDEPSSAYGNKSLGEPPNIPPAAAIRNAVLDATGVAIDQIPLTPERVLMAIRAAGAKGKEG
ncbi:MAG: molybdopterin-dependent oxidoreductase [Spirochaetaceae bacterium]|jgi:xanthine dehydrogenase molybdenum-binding subunit|nr:molybdopterin-dependent oxidoreductase [Spirochaetaceae bacterium]